MVTRYNAIFKSHCQCFIIFPFNTCLLPPMTQVDWIEIQAYLLSSESEQTIIDCPF